MESPSVRGGGFGLNSQRNFASICELDGVPNQVGQDLTQTARISEHGLRCFRRGLTQKLESLFIGPEGERFQGRLHALTQVEWRLFQIDFAGLDLREVENVVDDVQQGFSGQLDRLQVLSLLARQVRLQREIGHSDDAVQRSADFMAHIGKKFALRAAAGLRCQLRPFPLLLG